MKKLSSRVLAALLVLLLAVGMMPAFGVQAKTVDAATIISAIEELGTDPITLENFGTRYPAYQRVNAAYSYWKATVSGAKDEDITNLADFNTVKKSLSDLMLDFSAVERASFGPEDLLAIAAETSVTGATTAETAGVRHAAGSAVLYDGVTTPYLGQPVYTMEVKEAFNVNSAGADQDYIYANNGSANGNLRFFDGDKEIVYEFDLSKFNNLCVTITVAQNYVLEAAGSPDGPWTVIADYGVIGGGARYNGDGNKTAYDIVFADLGITGKGYIRVSNVGRSGGWGGAVLRMVLSDAVLASESYLYNPGDRVRAEVDVTLPETAAAEALTLTLATADGSANQSVTFSGEQFAAMTEKTNHTYGYTYRTASVEWKLPTDSAVVESLKNGGLAFTVTGGVDGAVDTYRITVTNVTTEETVYDVSGAQLLPVAAPAGNPAAIELIPRAYEPFGKVMALRSAEGSGWYSAYGVHAPYADEFGNPYLHAGDEVEFTYDIFFEGSDLDDVPGGNTARLECYIQNNPDAADVGITEDLGRVISGDEYNEAELMLDDVYNGYPYKRFVRTFVIPDDDLAVQAVQTDSLRIRLGTHLNKNDWPFLIYGVELYNVSTDTVFFTGDAGALRTSSFENTREVIVDENVVGGIVGKKAPGLSNSVLVNGGFTTLPAGMYSMVFRSSTVGSAGNDKALLSAVTRDGKVLDSRLLTENTNAIYGTTTLLFKLEEETEVGFKTELFNNTDFYLESVKINQLFSAAEMAIQRVIEAINGLPAADTLTLDNASAVASVKRMYDRLDDTQKAAVTNADVLEAAVSRIDELQADADAAAAWDADVNALPKVQELGKSDKATVDALRAAYDDMSDARKALTKALPRLEEAEERMAKLDQASEEDVATAKAVDALIAALPQPKDLTWGDKAKVEEARTAFDALTEAQAALTYNEDILKAAEEAVAALTPAVTYGDINGDSTVNASDALVALQHSVKLKTLEGDGFTAADVDGNGSVNASDALLILQFSVKLIDKFPVEG